MEAGNLSNVDSDVMSDALARTPGTDADPSRTASATLQPDGPKGPKHREKKRGKLAANSALAGHKGETGADLRGQIKPKIKKKNRLGQRARQQLGRAKQAQSSEGSFRNTFAVRHTPVAHTLIMY